MTTEKEAKIKELVEIAERARAAYENSSVMQVPKDFEERIKRLAEHMVLKAKLLEAENALDALIYVPR